MQDPAISILAIRKTAFEATLAVDVQKKMIAAMRAGDPRLPFANLMLCIMQQNAAMSEMNLAFDPEHQAQI